MSIETCDCCTRRDVNPEHAVRLGNGKLVCYDCCSEASSSGLAADGSGFWFKWSEKTLSVLRARMEDQRKRGVKDV
jgi:hypothetical protein